MNPERLVIAFLALHPERRRQLVAEFPYGDTPKFDEARAIAAFARDLFLRREVDQVLLVATKFIPPPDLTNAEFQRQRTDGFWHSYILAGGAVMPAYGEALSSEEAWHLVNYLRSLVAAR